MSERENSSAAPHRSSLLGNETLGEVAAQRRRLTAVPPPAPAVRIAVVRRNMPPREKLAGVIVHSLAGLAAILMIRNMFGIRIKRALGFVVLFKLLTATEPEYSLWTHES